MNYNQTEKIILYLINKLGDKIEGKKKVMKLMFLVEHYDVNLKKLIRNGLLGNNFLIYYYGVFSLSIMNCVSGLIQKGIIEEGFPLKSTEKIEIEQKDKEKVDKIIQEFGEKTGYELEVETLKMIDIEPSDKEKFFGRPIRNLIKG